jgi:hypothetical protein
MFDAFGREGSVAMCRVLVYWFVPRLAALPFPTGKVIALNFELFESQ